MSDIQNKLQEYAAKLDELQQKCSEAEKDAIVAETNLKNCVKQKEELIAELEAFTNCQFEDIPSILQKEQSELETIMQRIMQINITSTATQGMLDSLNSIIADFGIQEPSK